MRIGGSVSVVLPQGSDTLSGVTTVPVGRSLVVAPPGTVCLAPSASASPQSAFGPRAAATVQAALIAWILVIHHPQVSV